MGIYLAGTSNVPSLDTFGQMESMSPIHKTRLDSGVHWALDNGVFTDKFNEGEWAKQLERLQEYKSKCLFVTIPDVVGDWDATLKRFNHYRSWVTDYPVALVTQDNVKTDEIPWDSLDAIFIGGTDWHKLGREGGQVINAAKDHNKWLHVGRVNSPKRLLKFWMADSWDGTQLGFEPSNAMKFHAAVLQARSMRQTKGLL